MCINIAEIIILKYESNSSSPPAWIWPSDSHSVYKDVS